MTIKSRKKKQKRTRCPNGTRKNKKTNKCEKKKKERKTKFLKSKMKKLISKKTIILKSKTPELNKQIRESLEKPSETIPSKKNLTSLTKSITNSFSPSVNKELETLKSLTPEANIFTCPMGEINVKTKNGYECKSVYDDSPEIKQLMLKNLNVKAKKINYDLILAPKQSLSNCWFNVFFMVFFISDKGRKFFRYLRKSMITGILPNKELIDPSMKLPLFLLNFFIEASFVGKNDPSKFGEVMDTNILIQYIGDALKQKKIHHYEQGESGNPLRFYSNIMDYLNTKPIEMISINIKYINDTSGMYFGCIKKIPDILYLNQKGNRSQNINKNYTYTIKGKKVKYILDSAIIRSQNQNHYSCYITGNKKEYAFDGASFSYLLPFKWKDKINSNDTWKFEDKFQEVFDFKLCDVTYFYYRNEKKN